MKVVGRIFEEYGAVLLQVSFAVAVNSRLLRTKVKLFGVLYGRVIAYTSNDAARQMKVSSFC